MRSLTSANVRWRVDPGSIRPPVSVSDPQTGNEASSVGVCAENDVIAAAVARVVGLKSIGRCQHGSCR